MADKYLYKSRQTRRLCVIGATQNETPITTIRFESSCLSADNVISIRIQRQNTYDSILRRSSTLTKTRLATGPAGIIAILRLTKDKWNEGAHVIVMTLRIEFGLEKIAYRWKLIYEYG